MKLKINMEHSSWRKFHTIVEILCQSGDKKVLLDKALLELYKIDQVDIPPEFRVQIEAIKRTLLPAKNVHNIVSANNISYPIQNLTEDEVDEIFNTFCELESFTNSN